MKRLFLLTLTAYLTLQATTGFAGLTQEANKQTVTQFYQKALNEKDYTAAQKYLGSWYIQHNPAAQDGLDGLKNYIAYLKNTYPNSRSEIKRIMAEGDYVVVHVHSVLEPGTKGQAIIDIFRLEHNKIYEHWDVIQAIPDEAANDNGMF